MSYGLVVTLLGFLVLPIVGVLALVYFAISGEEDY